MGIDIWDADPANVRAVWIDDGLATYPMLVNGSQVGSEYGVGQDYYFVIDHEGFVRYRSRTGPLGERFVDGEIRDAIEASLEDLADFLEEEEEIEEITTEVASSPQLPARFEVGNAYPNPFNSETTLSFAVSAAGLLNLTLFDLGGRVVRDWSGQYEAGRYSLTWDGLDEAGNPMASGVYIASARQGSRAITRKVTLLK
ncbi:MAG: T9SS type A sorting domain-containing protein [Gemmatimonadetes bacterium]|nr:T9SS type A sorting domain-containing protein [Gemmatimonadota bacterium]